MKKNNTRSEKTKEMLKMSLLDLLSRKNMEDITVKELCDLAGVQRGTFYWHYNNIAELFEEIMKEDMNAIVKFHATRQRVDLKADAVIEYLNFIKDKHTFLFVEYKELDEFEQFKNSYKDMCINIFANSLGVDLSDKVNYNAFCFIFAGIYEYISQWIVSGFNAPVDEVANHVFVLIEAITKTLPTENDAGS